VEFASPLLAYKRGSFHFAFITMEEREDAQRLIDSIGEDDTELDCDYFGAHFFRCRYAAWALAKKKKQ
jgi:hypothetical protein